VPENKEAKQQEIDKFNKELEDLEDAASGAFCAPKPVQSEITKQKKDKINDANQ
jgi:hypothetical protein